MSLLDQAAEKEEEDMQLALHRRREVAQKLKETEWQP